jgi:probable F420-dependent oxidoreductase
MRIGIVFPQTEFGNDPAAIRDYAQTAEGLGFTHIVAYDHVLGANPNRPGGWKGPYTHESPFHEPFVLFSFMAALTQKIEFVPGVIILPQRQTALVAKQAAAVDVLSGGRMRLGVGIGWNFVEYEALGENFRNRGRRIEEQVALMRRLWTEELIDFDGRYHGFKQAGINPLPVQRPIPVWMGGMDDRVLRRIAQIADGWFPQFQPGPQAAETMDRLRGYIRDAGRPNDAVGIEGRISMYNTPADQWASALDGWRELGATHVSFNTMNARLASPQDHIDTLRRFIELAKPWR